MAPARTLARKLALIGSTFLALALGSIGLTLWVSWQLEGGAAAVNEAGRLRMLTWQLAATPAASDGAQTRAALIARLEAGLALLREGDPARPLLVPWNGDARARFAAVETDLAALAAAWRGADPPSGAAAAPQAAAFVARVDGFVEAIERALARWTALLHAVQLALLALALASAVAMLYASYLFVLNPLQRLRSGLAQVQAGDLATRVRARTRDEFGQLAEGFNRMAETLQELYGNLEARVREKTARLELQHERLAALYEASAFLARTDSLEAMARGFVRQMRRIARADAAALRWADEAVQRYHLLAGDCLPRAIADAEPCLAAGGCACGQPRGDAGTRVIAIHEAVPPGTASACAEAGFEHLVPVPVVLKQRVLGEVDLLYRGEVALSDDERSLLDALASHLASAMEGLRAGALEREAAVAEERGLLARELHDSIAQSLAFLKIQVQILRDALRRGDELAVARTLDELDAGVRESTTDVRELLLHFRTRTSGEDIVPALRATLQKFEHQTGLPAQLSVDGEGLPLPPDVQVQVLHVLQEALSNVRKHARARGVWVEVQRGRDWRFEVRDDGRGFDAEAAPDETHVGLRIMRERAARIGAQVAVDSVPGAGTCVSLTLPAAAAARPRSAEEAAA
ncbi:MAG: type IV pili methyl-accepting chemotaxis transducer N-terminal domain-containing protein [Burkholderiales bacterium]|nr:type IV pili methyl-accepting chemotaxis transducer N-terminal domain-containing protein [Burkholderiales bacterium]